MDVCEIVAQNAMLKEVADKVVAGGHHVLAGVSGSQRALVASLLMSRWQRPLLFVTSTQREAELLVADFDFFSPGKGYVFPGRPLLTGEIDAESNSLDVQRLIALESVVNGTPCLVAAPASALLECLPPLDEFRARRLRLTVGDKVFTDALVKSLQEMGYELVAQVVQPGQISRRGEIFDIFPATHSSAVRIEFFDVEIESIRLLDVDTQRSHGNISSLSCGPARVLSLNAEARQRVIKKIDERRGTLSPHFLPQLDQDSERLETLQHWPGCRQYIRYIFPEVSSLLDYFADSFIIAAEPGEILKSLEMNGSELLDRLGNMVEKGKLLPDLQPFFTVPELVQKWQQRRTIHLTLLMQSVRQFKLSGTYSVPFRQVPSFYGQQQLIADEIKAWLKSSMTIVLVGAGQQLAQFLSALDIPVRHVQPEALQPQVVNFVKGRLSSGFELHEQKLVVLSISELVAAKKTRRVKTHKQDLTGDDVQLLVPGEYVVHVNHGIGQFMGVVNREIAGAKRDYLYIKYAGHDKLYLPTDQVHLLQRYLGGSDKPPKLYALGGGEWQRVKKRVKESVQKLAYDLLKLYARRQSAQGHAFAPDSPWQRELEDSFPWQETADQIQAIQEVKADMEAARPMDRLLCGDVGYGKTEVALRAAMKAVMDGKQVVVLAPTTVLAQQHFRTFRERFAPFPIKVEVLSRFKAPKQQKEVVEGVNAGTVDIIIGTHRLLQKDVLPPNMGLLIIDEEQRFGVEHKERFKELRANVDILTMTATPIPRTLHMAMMGVRDLSVIDTPPEGRFPVQTYVVEYSDDVVVHAVQRELDRGGQVYLIYNRIRGIDALAARLRRLLPSVSIGVVHGQMSENELERIMLDFYEGRYQVLLSTTIVENGLDIPNVNTVVIYDADRLGLAQLYQLRGRVGRGRRLAYAYLTYRKDKVLSERAQKRLAAIKELTQLGAGYKIALKDLEIRGAGNLLGPEQHGFISAVGFDLYCQLLAQQINHLKGQGQREEVGKDISLEIPVNAFIPDNYLPEGEKIYVYRRLKNALSLQAVDDLQDELLDRFGKLPPPVTNLLDLTRIKILAACLGVISIEHVKDSIIGTEKIKLTFAHGREPDPTSLQRLWSGNRERLDFVIKGSAVVYWHVHRDLLAELEGLLHQLSNCQR